MYLVASFSVPLPYEVPVSVCLSTAAPARSTTPGTNKRYPIKGKKSAKDRIKFVKESQQKDSIKTVKEVMLKL